MDGSQTSDPGVVDALDGSDPEFEVGADGVLHQHGDVYPAQRIGNLLHGEGVGGRTGSDPEQVDSTLQGCFDVSAGGDFRGGVHAGFVLHALEPGDTLFTDALEASGFGAGFPEPGTVDPDPFGCKGTGGLDDLFFGFGTARAGND